MAKPKIIRGKFFREHPLCIKAGTLVEFVVKRKRLNDGMNGVRLYFDGYDTFGRRKVTDCFDLYPVFKEVAKNGGMNRSRSHFVDASGFSLGYYDLKVIAEPEY